MDPMVAAPAHQWRLAWSDEFNTQNGSRPDPSHWSFDTGGDGFGNDELEYYTSRPDNAVIENGNLVITARKEHYGPDGKSRDYTSARLQSREQFSQAYGRFEARIKIPSGQGMWPAFWMLGNNSATAGWPDCGEIDIMENVGKEPTIGHGSLHGPGYSGGECLSSPFTLPDKAPLANDFHTYAVEWKPDSVQFLVDGTAYHTFTPKDVPAGKKWAYDHPFYLILNLAVGGGWPGPPDQSTQFPQRMLIDYVRVYTPAK